MCKCKSIPVHVNGTVQFAFSLGMGLKIVSRVVVRLL